MSDTLEIDGRRWRIPKSADRSRGWVPLRPTDGTSEGGTGFSTRSGRFDVWGVALPDGVTTAKGRTAAVAQINASSLLPLLRIGAANLWIEGDGGEGWEVWRRPTGKLHLAVLRCLAKHPGQWVCSRTLNAESSWRFASHVKQLRDRHGYPIESARCNDVLHSHHKATVGAYRLPGLNGPGERE